MWRHAIIARLFLVRLAALALAAALAPAPAAAQSSLPETPPEAERADDPAAPAPGGPRRYLTPDEFRVAFENKTVHLQSGPNHYGSEFYLPGDRTVWIGRGQPCKAGVWTYSEPLYCFRYEDPGEHCWRVFESGGAFFAESIDGLLLEVYAVEERPLTCDPELFS